MESDNPPRSRVTIVDIALAVGVTPTTVSNAFNRPDQLSSALRERVLSTAANMGYLGPDAAARSMRRGRLHAVGVLYADRLSNAFTDAAFVLFLEGLARAAEEANHALTLLPGLPTPDEPQAAVGAAVVDGFVVYSMADDDPLVVAAGKRRLPLVTVDSPRLAGVPHVGIDDRAAAHSAAQHLLQLGHRRLAIVAGDLLLDRRSGPADLVRQKAATFGVNRDRLRGYADAVAAAGLDWAAVPVEEVAEADASRVRSATARLLAARPRPSAILVMSDRMALEVLDTARDLGLSTPEDLAVVGFDDIPAAAWAVPSLTTVGQPHVEKGLAAGRLLNARLAGRPVDDPVLLPTEVVTRDSTGPVPRR